MYRFLIVIIIALFYSGYKLNAQCNATAYANGGTTNVNICYGQSVNLTSIGGCPNYVMNNDFNNGTPGTGWNATNQAMFTNPCPPHSIDGTIYMWMGSTSPAPRILTTVPFNVSTGGTIQFEMRYAVQGLSSPCEGPDLYNEGIGVQYSTNGGSTWNTMVYYAPNGNILNYIPTTTSPGISGATVFTVWTIQTIAIPPAAQTTSTMFRWAQTSSSGNGYDHWGLDNVSILVPPPSINVWWSHGATGNNPPPVIPLNDTTYTVFVSDGVDTAQSSVNITVNPIPSSSFTITSPLCIGETGTITYTGGAGPLATYNWNFDGGTVISGTGQGPYQVMWTNSGNKIVSLVVTENACSSLQTIHQLTVNPNPVVSGLNYNPVCINTTLQLFSSLQAGSSYSWSGPAGFSANVYNPTLSNFTSLNNGYYVLTMTDLNTCTASDSILVQLSPNPVPDAGLNQTICKGSQAVLNASGGVGYQWSNGASGQSITVTPLITSTYVVTVTNSHGCSASDNVVVNVVDINNSFFVSDVLCNGGNTGSVVASPTGGIAPYTYMWSTGSTTAGIIGLSIGTYTVTITDNIGCFIISQQIINEPPPLAVSVISHTNVSCYNGSDGTAFLSVTGGPAPYSYIWSPLGGNANPGTGFPEGTFYVTVTDANACQVSTSVTITQPYELEADITSFTDATCFGLANGTAFSSASGGTLPYSYAWNTNPPQYVQNPVNIIAGTYTLSVTDANSCLATAQLIINQPPEIVIIMSPLNEHCVNSCDGSASASVSGGAPPYQYLWSNASTSDNISSLCASTYFLTVTDASNCIANSSADILTNTFINASANLSPTSGGSPLSVQFYSTSTGASQYEWNFGDGSQTSNLENPVHVFTVNGSLPETFTITLTVNSGFPDNCEDVYTLTLLVHPPSSIEIPNVFTPNGDGYNDRFEIKTVSMESIEAVVFNRWGKKVAEWNSLDGYWDGKLGGGQSEASEGTYYFIVTAKGIDNVEYKKQGTVSLIR